MRRRAQIRRSERARRRAADREDAARAAAAARLDRARRRLAIVGLVDAATADSAGTPIPRRARPVGDAAARRDPATEAFVLAR